VWKYTMTRSDGTNTRNEVRYEEVEIQERSLSIRTSGGQEDDETHRIGCCGVSRQRTPD